MDANIFQFLHFPFHDARNKIDLVVFCGIARDGTDIWLGKQDKPLILFQSPPAHIVHAFFHFLPSTQA